MEPVTNEETQLLFKFRQMVSDLHLQGDKNSDTFLLRWIRSQDHNLNSAKEMLETHLEWRKVNKIDDIFDWQAPEDVLINFPVEVLGFNKIGCPVPLGQWNIRKGVESGQTDVLVRYIDQKFENLEKLMKQRSAVDKPSTQIVLIFDWMDFSFMQLASVPAVDGILEIVKRFESNRPETLFSSYAVNTSSVFWMLLNLVKPFLSPKTLGKVQIFQTDASEWRAALLREIDPDQLPKYFGGTASTSLKYYNDIDCGDEGLSERDVGAGERFLLDFNVQSLPTVISWKFKTVYYDIGFRIIRVPDGNNGDNVVEVVQKYERFETPQNRLIRGQLICDKIGKYTVEFDNSYSLMRGKTLHYDIKIES